MIYIYLYIGLTAFDIFGVVSEIAEGNKHATIVWEGDSREMLQGFPDGVRQNLGFQLWQLQLGERPADYRPLSSVGQGVFELRD